MKGVDDEKLSKGLSGIIGVTLTFGIGMIRVRAARPPEPPCTVADRRLGRERQHRDRSDVSGTHAHALYVPGDSAMHRVRPECKLLAQLLFVFAVVATPREAFWAFGVYAIILLALMHVAGLPPRFVAKRLVIEVPFILFAVLMPFLAHGEQIVVLGIPMYVSGLWAAWNILIKATLGLVATIVVSSTTPMADLLRGLERLHLPHAFTSIAGVHDAIPGRDRRRGAADADRTRFARRTTLGGSGRRKALARRRARCSSARTSVVSACTWRCSRAATTGRLPERTPGRHGGRVGGARSRCPAFAALVAATAWVIQP